MAIAYFHPWEVIGAIEIAFFALILAAVVYPAFILVRKIRKLRFFYIRYYIIIIAKILGGALTIAYVNDYDSIGLAIAASVFGNIGFGFIAMMTITSIKYIDSYKEPKLKGKKKRFRIARSIINLFKQDYTQSKSWEKFVEKFIFVPIIISSVGSSYTSSDRKLAKGLMEAGSLLFLFTLILVTILLIHRFIKTNKENLNPTDKRFELNVLGLTTMIIPFLLVRVLYNVLAAFTFKVNGDYYQNVSKYTFLFGDWKYYAFIAFLEECICSVFLMLITFVIFNYHRKEKTYESSSSYPENIVDGDSKVGGDIETGGPSSFQQKA